MNSEKIGQQLYDHFGAAVFLHADWAAPQPWFQLGTDQLVQVCEWLHDEYFDHCTCITGLDNGPDNGTLEILYHLYSIVEHVQLVVKVVVPRNHPGQPLPEVPTVSHIWRTADWHEREIYDLLGIHFVGHPDLRRILLPADWEGYPLRKDYGEQAKYHGLKVAY